MVYTILYMLHTYIVSFYHSVKSLHTHAYRQGDFHLEESNEFVPYIPRGMMVDDIDETRGPHHKAHDDKEKTFQN